MTFQFPSPPEIFSQYISDGVCLIGEAGTGCLSSKKHAQTLINAFAETGMTAVKHQYVIADEILHPLTGPVSLPSGNIDLYSRFKELERPVSFYQDMKKITEEKDMLFMCSAFGIKSADHLLSLNTPVLKLASPESNHPQFLPWFTTHTIPVVFSTGISSIDDIVWTHNSFLDAGYSPHTLGGMQCVTWYPAPSESYNLLTLYTLPYITGIHFGLSDHTKDPYVIPCISAVLSGFINIPCIIEKHITLSKTSDGLDDPFAITPAESQELLLKMKACYSKAQEKSKVITKNIIPVLEKYDRMKKNVIFDADAVSELALHIHNILPEYSVKIISDILGNGHKKVETCEETNYLTTNRSLRAVKNIQKGCVLTYTNCAYLRTEKNLSPGLDYTYNYIIDKKKAACNIENGQPITSDIIS
jgi:sialic acid synthase SpsE